MKGTPEENMIKYYNVYPGIDIRYTVYEDLLLEEFIVSEYMSVSVVEQMFHFRESDKKIQPDLTEVKAVYNDQNNTVTVYDELDHYVTRYYDGFGRLVKTDWCLSPTTSLTETYTYNYLNRLSTKTDAGGHTFSYENDSKGRPTKVFNSDSTFEQIHYSDTTNIASVIDETQHKKEYHYDWLGNLLWMKEYTDSVNYYLTQYEYDDLGNLTCMTNASGNTTFYEYNSLFGITRILYPNSTSETFSYDAAGDLD